MSKKGKLTERQQNILQAVKEYIDEHAFPPSLREIAEATDTSSVSVVKYNLGVLQDRGLVKVMPNTARGIRVL